MKAVARLRALADAPLTTDPDPPREEWPYEPSVADVDSDGVYFGLRIRWVCDEGCKRGGKPLEFPDAWSLAGHFGRQHHPWRTEP